MSEFKEAIQAIGIQKVRMREDVSIWIIADLLLEPIQTGPSGQRGSAQPNPNSRHGKHVTVTNTVGSDSTQAVTA